MRIYLYLGLAAAIVAGLVVLFHLVDDSWATKAGIRTGEASKQAEWDRATLAAHRREEVQGGQAAAGLEADREKDKPVVRTITQYVDRVVERPIYRDRCLDDDGLRLVACAIRGDASSDRCKPDESMRGPPAAPRGNGGGGVALDHVDRGALSGLRLQAATALRGREVAEISP